MFCPTCGTRSNPETPLCPLCHFEFVPGAAARLHATAPVQYGGFWRRSLALFLDAILLFFPGAIVRVLLGMSITGPSDSGVDHSVLAGALEVGIDWLYAALMLSSRSSATLGMQVMGLRMTTVEGGRISFARATGRYLALVLTFLTFGIGYVMQVFTRRRQTLHDKIARTVVVRVAHEPELSAASLAQA